MSEGAEQWAVVEVMGHRRHVGRISEVDRFGATFVRIEMLKEMGPPERWEAIDYAGSALFSVRPIEKETALQFYLPRSFLPLRATDDGQDDSPPNDGDDEPISEAGDD